MSGSEGDALRGCLERREMLQETSEEQTIQGGSTARACLTDNSLCLMLAKGVGIHLQSNEAMNSVSRMTLDHSTCTRRRYGLGSEPASAGVIVGWLSVFYVMGNEAVYANALRDGISGASAFSRALTSAFDCVCDIGAV